MAKAEKRFLIHAGVPTKEVVVDSITRDATNEECIFDLIDNSIDAARNVIFVTYRRSLGLNCPTDIRVMRSSSI